MIYGQDPGLLDRRVALFYSTPTRNAGGGTVHTWNLVGYVWASFKPQTGREIQQAGQKISLALATFRLRWRTDIRASWRIVYDSVVYDLLAAPVQVGRKQYIDCVGQAITDVPVIGTVFIGMQAFNVPLINGDNGLKPVVFPFAYGVNPSGIYATLLIPTGGFSFEVPVSQPTITPTGFSIDLAAIVPGDGYSISVIVTP